MAKTYTTVIDKVSGDVFSETMWDTYIRDNINNLILPCMTSCGRAADVSVTTATITDVVWDVEWVDTDAMHNTGSNQQRFTINTAGLYLFTSGIRWNPNVTGVREMWLKKNSVTTHPFGRNDVAPSNSGSYGTANSVSSLLSLVATDFIVTQVYQNSGGNLIFGDGSYGTAIWVSR